MKRFFCVLLVLLLCVPAMAEGDSAGEAAPVVKYDIVTGLYGYADARGRYITEPIYESAEPFSCGYGLAETKDTYYYINTDGEVAAEFDKSEDWCYSFSEGIALIIGQHTTAYDTDFQAVFTIQYGKKEYYTDWWTNAAFSNGYLCVQEWEYDNYELNCFMYDVTSQYLDKTGRVVYECEGDARGFSFGLAMVERTDGRFVYLNSDFEEAIVLEEGAQGTDFSEGLALVQYSDGYGYIDTEGNEAFGGHVRFEYAENFSCGYAVAHADGLRGYIGRDGEWATEQRFERINAFSDAGVAEVRYEGSDGYWLIDTDFQIIAECGDKEYFPYDNDTFGLGGEIYRRGEDGKFHHAQQVLTDFDRERYYAFTGDLVPELGEEASLRFEDGEDLPRVDGATALIPMYNGFVQAVYPDSVRFTALSGDVMEPETGSTQLTCTKSSQIFSRLAAGLCDIIFSAYPSDDQAAAAMDEYGATFHYTPIAREAFVFFVNPDNPVENLSLEDVRNIYSGRVTDWSELGVSDIGSIAAFQRNRGSGSQTALERLMEGDTLMQAPVSYVYDDMGGIVDSVEFAYENTENAIGYSVRFYVTGLMQADVKLLSIDGVAPTPENIRSGAYPCVIDLYAVTREGEGNPSVARFLGWLQTDEAREITEKSGYVAIEP